MRNMNVFIFNKKNSTIQTKYIKLYLGFFEKIDIIIILKIFDYILTIFPHFYLQNDKNPVALDPCFYHPCHYIIYLCKYL